jgi:hypothetical protein
MKKTVKKKSKYDIQYPINGTFLDVLKASVKPDKKRVKKKSKKGKTK